MHVRSLHWVAVTVAAAVAPCSLDAGCCRDSRYRRWKMLVPARGSVTWHDPHCIVCMLQVFRITQYSCPTSADDAGIVIGKTSIAFTPPVVTLYVTHPVWYIVTIFISFNLVDDTGNHKRKAFVTRVTIKKWPVVE